MIISCVKSFRRCYSTQGRSLESLCCSPTNIYVVEDIGICTSQTLCQKRGVQFADIITITWQIFLFGVWLGEFQNATGQVTTTLPKRPGSLTHEKVDNFHLDEPAPPKEEVQSQLEEVQFKYQPTVNDTPSKVSKNSPKKHADSLKES